MDRGWMLAKRVAHTRTLRKRRTVFINFMSSNAESSNMLFSLTSSTSVNSSRIGVRDLESYIAARAAVGLELEAVWVALELEKCHRL